MIALSVAETNHGLSAVCNAVENRVDDIEYIDNNCVCRNRSVAAKTLKQTVEHHKDCRKRQFVDKRSKPQRAYSAIRAQGKFCFSAMECVFLANDMQRKDKNAHNRRKARGKCRSEHIQIARKHQNVVEYYIEKIARKRCNHRKPRAPSFRTKF